MTSTRLAARALALAALTSAIALPAAADWPERTIRIVVPFGAGGPVDVIARLVAGPLGEELGQPVVVENRPGAGSTVGTVAVANADPDGYMLLMTSSALMINQSIYPDSPFDPVADFAPIMTIADSSPLIVAYPGSGITSIEDLVARATAEPGVLNYASPGAGTSSHLTGEFLKLRADIDLVHVPFGGAGPAMQAILAGTTDVAVTSLPPSLPHVRSGDLVALAITSADPWPGAEDIPTMRSLGFDDVVITNVTALLAPAGTPSDVIERLSAELGSLLARDEMREAIAAAGFRVVGSTPDEMAEQIVSGVDLYRDLVTSAGITLD